MHHSTALAAQGIKSAFFTAPRNPFTQGPKGFRFASWVLHLRSRSLKGNQGQEVSLTKTEFALLLALLKKPQQVMSREQIMDMIQAEDEIFDRAIDVQILRLRRKIEAPTQAPSLLKTKRGQGYFLDAEVQLLD